MRPLRSPSSAAFHDQQWSLDVERCSTWVCIGVTTKMQISMLAIRKRSRQPGKWNDPGRRAPAAGRLRRHTPALGIGTPPARGAAVTWHRGDQMGTRGCRSRRLRVDFNNPIGWPPIGQQALHLNPAQQAVLGAHHRVSQHCWHALPTGGLGPGIGGVSPRTSSATSSI